MDDLYDHYKVVLHSGEEAMRRICLKMDIYWNPEIYKMVNKINSSASRVRQYISKTFMMKYLGKTYDDTLDEEANAVAPVSLQDVRSNADSNKKPSVSQEAVLFWGSGFSEDIYEELALRYEKWTKDLPKPLPVVNESIYKQICIQEVMINRNAAAGKDVEKGQNALSNLLGSLNVKPSQKKDDDGADLETTPLGVWAKRWEDNRPIPDYDDEFDEPKIIKYITTWFYGHIAKALGLKNMYSKIYEDEIAKYRVEKPEFENDDDDMVIADIVGGGDDV